MYNKGSNYRNFISSLSPLSLSLAPTSSLFLSPYPSLSLTFSLSLTHSLSHTHSYPLPLFLSFSLSLFLSPSPSPSLSPFTSGPPPVLTTGGIIGIVLAVLVLGFFIIPFVFGYGREFWKKGKLRGWWRRQRNRMHTWTQNMRQSPQVRRNPRPRSRSVPIESINTRTSSSSTNVASRSTSITSNQVNYF